MADTNPSGVGEYACHDVVHGFGYDASTLPFDIWVCIAEVLEQGDVYFFARVSRSFYNAAKRAGRKFLTPVAALYPNTKRLLEMNPAEIYICNPGFKIRIAEFLWIDLIQFSVVAGRVDVLEYVKGNDTWSRSNAWERMLWVCGGAGGHVHTIKWMMENLAERTDDYCVQLNHQAAWNAAAENGHMCVLEWAWENATEKVHLEEICGHGASGGHLNIVKWAYARGRFAERHPYTVLNDILANAIKAGQLDIVKWCVEEDSGLGEDDATVAAEQFFARNHDGYGQCLAKTFNTLIFGVGAPTRGDCRDAVKTVTNRTRQDILLWLLENGCPFFPDVIFDLTVDYCLDLKLLNILLEEDKDEIMEIVCDDPDRLIRAAIYRGHSDVLDWLRMHGFLDCELTDYVENAAKAGDLEIVKMLLSYGARGSARCAEAAGSGGNLDVLKYLRELECPWDATTCSAAARSGHLDILTWAHEHGCAWNTKTCSAAAESGSLEILRYAHDHGCEWDANTCSVAAGSGNFEMLRWAREHGCEWDATTCSTAAESGHLDILKWAHEHGCPWNASTCSAAAISGKLEILRYAREHGCEWNSAVCFYAAHGKHGDMFQWARENGCEWDARVCNEFAAQNDVYALQRAIWDGCPYDIDELQSHIYWGIDHEDMAKRRHYNEYVRSLEPYNNVNA